MFSEYDYRTCQLSKLITFLILDHTSVGCLCNFRIHFRRSMFIAPGRPLSVHSSDRRSLPLRNFRALFRRFFSPPLHSKHSSSLHRASTRREEKPCRNARKRKRCRRAATKEFCIPLPLRSARVFAAPRKEEKTSFCSSSPPAAVHFGSPLAARGCLESQRCAAPRALAIIPRRSAARTTIAGRLVRSRFAPNFRVLHCCFSSPKGEEREVILPLSVAAGRIAAPQQLRGPLEPCSSSQRYACASRFGL